MRLEKGKYKYVQASSDVLRWGGNDFRCAIPFYGLLFLQHWTHADAVTARTGRRATAVIVPIENDFIFIRMVGMTSDVLFCIDRHVSQAKNYVLLSLCWIAYNNVIRKFENDALSTTEHSVCVVATRVNDIFTSWLTYTSDLGFCSAHPHALAWTYALTDRHIRLLLQKTFAVIRMRVDTTPTDDGKYVVNSDATAQQKMSIIGGVKTASAIKFELTI